MDWKEFAFYLLPFVWTGLLMVTGRYLLPKFKEWLDAKIDGEKHGYIEKIVLRATDAVYTAVRDIGQTYVDAIKEGAADGKLTAEERASAKRRAVRKARDLIGPAGLDVLLEVLGSDVRVNKFLESKIEAAVKDVKTDP